MRKLLLLPILTLIFSVAIAQNQYFEPTNLSEMEMQDCQKFMDKKGEVRWDEFEKIKHIFPSCDVSLDSTQKIISFDEETLNFIMTESQLIQLIGEPDFEDNAYELGIERYDCEVAFAINDKSIVLGIVYSNCNEFYEE